MTRIGVEHPSAEVELHSCRSCGQHAWRRDGAPVDRGQLLEALQAHRPTIVPAARPRPVAKEKVEAERRADLQRLLSTFQVHGSTS